MTEPLFCNVAVVAGVLSSDPVLRELDSGELVVQYEVTVRGDDDRASTVPVAWRCTGSTRRPDVGKGDRVVATGRISRRFFRAGGRTQSRTELAADRVIGAGRRRPAVAAIERALAAVSLE